MVNFFYKIYSSIPAYSSGSAILNKFRLYSIMRFIVRNIADLLIPLYYRMTLNNSTHKLHVASGEINATNRTIVSLTTFPMRIDRIWLVIESILRQSVKPDKIILWLSKEQFDGFDTLPDKVKKQTERGLEIRFVDGDIRSHKKYFYAIQQFPKSLIITVDDDFYYRNDLIESMMICHSENPSNIISFYCRDVARNDGELCSYNNWANAKKPEVSISELFFGSGGGTLFPPDSLYKDILDVDLFMELSALADDIWLNAMSRLKETPIRYVSNDNGLLLPVLFKENNTLSKQNVYDNMNDVQIANVRRYYLETKNIDPFRKIN